MSDESTVVSPESEDSEEREPEAHDAGATRSSAHDLGDVTGAGKVQNHEAQVGADGDAVDYYRFTLTQAREMRLGLWHREGDAELFLEDAEGTVLGRSLMYGNGKEAMVRTLGPGTYYVRVEAQGPEASAHQLKVLAMEPYEVYTYKGAVFAKLLGLPSFGEWRHEWSLSENADGSGEPVSLGTAWASDLDGDVLRYSLVGGNESGLFTIDATSGEVFYIGAGVDYESGAGPYELTVRASDGTHTIDATVTVTVADIPEAPVFTESSYEFFLAENADGNDTRISLGTVSASDPDGATVGYSLVGGHESGRFAIDESSGEVFYAGSGEDHESVPSHELTVRASDGTSTTDTTVTVTVTDAPEAPQFAQASYEFILTENAVGNETPVSLGTVSATDPDRGDTLRYSLVGGNDSGRFTIDAASGEVFYAGSGEDFESGAGPFELTVRASDETLTVDATVTVTVTDVPEAPQFTESSYEFFLAENAVGNETRISLGTVSATDPEGATVGYTLVGGNESGLFAIDEVSGEVFYAGPGEDFESVTGPHELTIRASDGTSSTDTTVTVTVTDVPEAPSFAQPSYEFILAENADGNETPVSLGTVAATDPDRGDTLRYSLVGGNESGRFTVDASSGEVFYAGSGEDFESGAGPYELTVRASDETLTVEATVTVTVTDVPEAPEFAQSSYEFTLAENTDGSGTPISLGTVAATDPEGATVGYTLVGGNESGRFAIDASSGEVFYAGPGEDFESVPSHALTVRASDGASSADIAVTVAVTDIRGDSEAPGADLPQDRTTPAVVLVDEGAVRGTIGSAQDLDWFAVDLAGGRTYQVDLRGRSTNDGTLIDPYLMGLYDADGRLIGGTTAPDGGIGFNSWLEFVAPRDGRYYIAATGNGYEYSGTGTYEVEVREVPMPVFSQASYRYDLAENADGSGTPLSLGTVQATDPDGGTLRYSLVGGNDSGRFTIDASSGELHYAGPGEDYESEVTSHRLTVRASDGEHSTDTTVTVAVTDESEAPAFAAASYAFPLAENADGSENRVLLGTVQAADPDVGDTLRYSLVGGNDSGTFEVDASSGELFYVGAGEHAANSARAYGLTVRASDGTHDVDTAVTVTLVAAEPDPVSQKATGPQGTSEPADEDLPAARSTNGEVVVDAEPIEGTLASPSDRDWFAITLAPGRTYVFSLERDAPSGGPVPVIRGLRDSNGNPLPGIADGPEVRYTTDEDAPEAVYYVEVGGPDTPTQGASAPRGLGTRSISIVPRSDNEGSSDYRLRANEITDTMDVTDDYPADTTTTGVITVGGSAPGNIERSGDRDWFAVTLEAGTTYRIDLEGSLASAGTLLDPYLRGIHGSDGNLIAGTTDDDGGHIYNSRHYYTPESSGTHFIAAGAFRNTTGTYRVSVTESGSDDHPAGTGTTVRVQVGDTATGNIDHLGDRDWFAVTLEAGRVYRIDLEGSPTSTGTLSDTYLLGVHDANGDLIPGTTDDRGGTGNNSRLYFEPTTAGSYYIAAGAYLDGHTGTYRVSVTAVEDDHPARTDTTATVAVGGSATGHIQFTGDRDWFAVTLEAGKVYRIDLEGSPTSAGGLTDPYLGGVHDAVGNLISGTNDYDGGVGRNSQIYFRPETPGTYYISAGGYSIQAGTYRLSVTEVEDIPAGVDTSATVTVGSSATGEIDRPGDQDWFAVTLEAGKGYWIDLEGSPTAAGTLQNPYLRGIHDANGNLIPGTTDNWGGVGSNSRVFFECDTPGTYYIAAGSAWNHTGTYRLSVTEPGDDYSAGTDTSGTVTVGSPTTGNIERPGDRDWFAVTLEAGKTYNIELSEGTVWLPELHGVHDANGNLVSSTTENDWSTLIGSRFYFETDTPGTYYIAAGAFRTYTGTYGVSVKEVGSDDHPASTGTTLTVPVDGTAVTGDIGHPGDQDWFAATLEAGKNYRIYLEGSDTSAGTLQEPLIRGVHDAQGNLIPGTNEYEAGTFFDSRTYFRPDTAGTYYIAATGFQSHTGTFRLSVTELAPDQTAGTDTSGTVAVGGTAAGEIEGRGDQDWFAVTFEAGTTYRIDLEGKSTSAGTLRDPELRGVHDTDGHLIHGTTDRDSGTGRNSRLVFEPEDAGTYYIAAGAFAIYTGSYELSVEEVL